MSRSKSTGEKDEVLMVRSEISSTLGRKSATWELVEESESRLSQGESWIEGLFVEKKESLDENAMPNENPSLFWILVSRQGE